MNQPMPTLLHIVANGRTPLDAPQLKVLRQRACLSQEAVSEGCLERRLCVSLASIKRAEAGKAVLYRTARHLATFYGVEVMTLICRRHTDATAAAQHHHV